MQEHITIPISTSFSNAVIDSDTQVIHHELNNHIKDIAGMLTGWCLPPMYTI